MLASGDLSGNGVGFSIRNIMPAIMTLIVIGGGALITKFVGFNYALVYMSILFIACIAFISKYRDQILGRK